MTPKPPPWLVTHISHGTLGDRVCPLRGTQPPRQAAWHAPPAPHPTPVYLQGWVPPSLAVPSFPSTPCLPAPSPPQHSTAHLGTWHLLGGGCSRHPILGQGGLAGGLGGPSSQGSTPCGLVTGSHKPSSRWLILVKPVVKMCPSRVKMARTGLSPSWGANLSWREGETVSTGHGEVG